MYAIFVVNGNNIQPEKSLDLHVKVFTKDHKLYFIGETAAIKGDPNPIWDGDRKHPFLSPIFRSKMILFEINSGKSLLFKKLIGRTTFDFKRYQKSALTTLQIIGDSENKTSGTLTVYVDILVTPPMSSPFFQFHKYVAFYLAYDKPVDHYPGDKYAEITLILLDQKRMCKQTIAPGTFDVKSCYTDSSNLHFGPFGWTPVAKASLVSDFDVIIPVVKFTDYSGVVSLHAVFGYQSSKGNDNSTNSSKYPSYVVDSLYSSSISVSSRGFYTFGFALIKESKIWTYREFQPKLYLNGNSSYIVSNLCESLLGRRVGFAENFVVRDDEELSICKAIDFHNITPPNSIILKLTWVCPVKRKHKGVGSSSSSSDEVIEVRLQLAATLYGADYTPLATASSGCSTVFSGAVIHKDRRLHWSQGKDKLYIDFGAIPQNVAFITFQITNLTGQNLTFAHSVNLSIMDKETKFELLHAPMKHNQPYPAQLVGYLYRAGSSSIWESKAIRLFSKKTSPEEFVPIITAFFKNHLMQRVDGESKKLDSTL